MGKTILFTLFTVFLMTSQGHATERDRIAVASEGNTVTSEVSEVAARSSHFLIFDGDGTLLESVNNPYQTVKGGAASSVIPFLSQKGVTLLIAGDFGQNMIQAMNRNGMRYLKFRGKAEAALKKALEEKNETPKK